MFVASFNHHVGDVLLLLVGEANESPLSYERKENFARVFRVSDNTTVAWNVFAPASCGLSNLTDGILQLSEADVAMLNAKNPFDEPVKFDATPKLVVAEIVKFDEHPSSDHLHVCQVDVGTGKVLQIVCGAPNARLGLKTVAALSGAIMPDGKLIADGVLRGVASAGMLCAPRELALPNAPKERGIIELDDELKNGEAFVAETMWHG
ncbi:MAG: DUF4479 and tRNA-binding domain-containing protein [Streptococcaceae bacterium]|jgi:tRNA-binding protein|nr:DUF4479 and tRNA-binding domain-containing protein [Streptococcaceae bacterium]